MVMLDLHGKVTAMFAARETVRKYVEGGISLICFSISTVSVLVDMKNNID